MCWKRSKPFPASTLYSLTSRIVALVLVFYEHYQTTKCGFSTLKLPGKTANPYTLVEHFINHPTSILYMENAVGKHVTVHQLQIFLRPDFLKRLPQFLSTFQRKIGTHFTNDGVHWMIH